MATYIGAQYKTENKATGEWDLQLLLTHANAVIQTDEKKFLSLTELSFLQSLMGDSTETMPYHELVNKVNTNEDSINSLQPQVNTNKTNITNISGRVGTIESLLNEDGDTIINNLHDIINFISSAEIEEGKTIGEFVEDLNIKNIVSKDTAPIPSDYGKGSFQGGEVWIDTGSSVPTDPIQSYVMTINPISDVGFLAPSLVHIFCENNSNKISDIYSSFPLMTFSTNEGVMKLYALNSIDLYGDPLDETHYLELALYKYNNTTSEYELYDTVWKFSRWYDAGQDTDIFDTLISPKNVVVPGGKILINSISDFDWSEPTVWEGKMPFTIEIVPN